MRNQVRRRETKKPVTMGHAAAVVAVGVVGVIIAFGVLSSIVGIVLFFVKLAVVVALIGAAFWLVSRFRR